MIMFEVQDYTIINHLFPRLLGFIYFCAFGAFIFQMKGLFGSNGILPVSNFLEWIAIRYGKKRFYYVPSLLWFNSSDKALIALPWLGTIISVFLMLGIYPSVMLFLLYFLYLSLESVGQDFLSFGWEGFLLETGFYAFFLSLTDVPNLAMWICISILLFRFHFQAGAVKIQSCDKTWRDLSAISYHYQTQPIANTQAWYFHKLPMWFHKASSYGMFVIELIVPFGIFFTEDLRLVVFVCFFGLQFFIWFTGNLSYLNHLTVVLSTILLNNTALLYIYPFRTSYPTAPLSMDIFLTTVGCIFIVLQLMRFWNHFYPHRHLNTCLGWLSPYNLVCRYGIFAVMTTHRYEVVIEGSNDLVTWKEYLFKHKPSEVTRRPRRVSPYQPRVDWQIWFLPFTSYNREIWFQSFLVHILKGTKDVLGLIRGNPFAEHPPKYVRAIAYEYVFSNAKQKKETGAWWVRTLVGPYSPTLSLKEENYVKT